MTREEARRLSRRAVPETEDNGPDPTEDPATYLQEARKEDEEREE